MKAESASRPTEHYLESLKFSSDLVLSQVSPKRGMLEPRYMRCLVSIQYRIARFRDKLNACALLIATPKLARAELIGFVEPLEQIRDRAAHCMVDLENSYKIRTSDQGNP